MKKYFIMSDIHSYASCMISALKKAGFKKSNQDHILVICGDIFDRGPETLEVFNFLINIPEDRLILIQGNHELLYLNLLHKSFPDLVDFSNGTVTTFCQIAGINPDELNIKAKLAKLYAAYSGGNKNVSKAKATATSMVMQTWQDVRSKVRESAITKWLKSDKWVNYFEVDDLICVHSFIPLQLKPDTANYALLKTYPTYTLSSKLLQIIPDWRSAASKAAWDDAKWGCPYQQFDAGLFESEISNNPNKKLVCGHWQTDDFHKHYGTNPLEGMNFQIYFGKNLIAIDACTPISQSCNVLVYDQKNNSYLNQFKIYLNDENYVSHIQLDPDKYSKKAPKIDTSSAEVIDSSISDVPVESNDSNVIDDKEFEASVKADAAEDSSKEGEISE